jgi:hypothetical protein
LIDRAVEAVVQYETQAGLLADKKPLEKKNTLENNKRNSWRK